MKHYELMYILPIKAGSEEDSALTDKIRATLQAEGATITAENNLGKKKLAYPIKGLRHGSYMLIEFDLPADKLNRLNNWFRLSTEILRSQIISKPVKSPEQLAREKAFQEKLMKLQAKEAIDKEPVAKTLEKAETKEPGDTTSVQFDDLDKKIEEILEQEIVK